MKQQVGQKLIYRIYHSQQGGIMQMISPETKKEVKPKDEKGKKSHIDEGTVVMATEEGFWIHVLQKGEAVKL